ATAGYSRSHDWSPARARRQIIRRAVLLHQHEPSPSRIPAEVAPIVGTRQLAHEGLGGRRSSRNEVGRCIRAGGAGSRIHRFGGVSLPWGGDPELTRTT